MSDELEIQEQIKALDEAVKPYIRPINEDGIVTFNTTPEQAIYIHLSNAFPDRRKMSFDKVVDVMVRFFKQTNEDKQYDQ